MLYRSLGYGLLLVSESTEGVIHAAEWLSYVHSDQSGATNGIALPEDIGQDTAGLVRLVEEIVRVRVVHACMYMYVQVCSEYAHNLY